jgi:hypothetical protein
LPTLRAEAFILMLTNRLIESGFSTPLLSVFMRHAACAIFQECKKTLSFFHRFSVSRLECQLQTTQT